MFKINLNSQICGIGLFHVFSHAVFEMILTGSNNHISFGNTPSFPVHQSTANPVKI